jgi:hypothetical protein
VNPWIVGVGLCHFLGLDGSWVRGEDLKVEIAPDHQSGGGVPDEPYAPRATEHAEQIEIADDLLGFYLQLLLPTQKISCAHRIQLTGHHTPYRVHTVFLHDRCKLAWVTSRRGLPSGVSRR